MEARVNSLGITESHSVRGTGSVDIFSIGDFLHFMEFWNQLGSLSLAYHRSSSYNIESEPLRVEPKTTRFSLKHPSQFPEAVTLVGTWNPQL